MNNSISQNTSRRPTTPRLSIVPALTIALGATLAACGTAGSPQAGSASGPPKPVPIDGTYSGGMQLSRGDAINCGDANPINLQVANRTFTYRLNQAQAEWKPVIVFTATIGPDGTFNARSGPDSMGGRVANGTMQGEIIGDICSFSFSAVHGGTW